MTLSSQYSSSAKKNLPVCLAKERLKRKALCEEKVYFYPRIVLTDIVLCVERTGFFFLVYWRVISLHGVVYGLILP